MADDRGWLFHQIVGVLTAMVSAPKMQTNSSPKRARIVFAEDFEHGLASAIEKTAINLYKKTVFD